MFDPFQQGEPSIKYDIGVGTFVDDVLALYILVLNTAVEFFEVSQNANAALDVRVQQHDAQHLNY